MENYSKEDVSQKIEESIKHQKIMDALSKVYGLYDTYFCINGNCHYWHVKGLRSDELIGIARRGNHEELMLMIEKYGQAAPTKEFFLFSGHDPYRNDHILPDEVQEIIAERHNPEEIRAFIKYQGFGESAQEIYFAKASHEERMAYLERHGLTPKVQEKLRSEGNQDEIRLHMRRHGMHFGWEKELVDGSFETFKDAISLHEFSIPGQCYLNEHGKPAFFAEYIKHWGQWREAHESLVKNRTIDEIRLYVDRHRFLSYEAEKELCMTASHEFLMHYILRRDSSDFGTFYTAFKDSKRQNTMEKLCIMQRYGFPNYAPWVKEEFLALEPEFMKTGSDDEIKEYINHFKPKIESIQILEQQNRLSLCAYYFKKWQV